MTNNETAGAEKAPERNSRKTRVGTVSSDKSNKTVTVVVTRRAAHPSYGKQVTSTKKYHAHDEKNEYRVGRRRADRRDPARFRRRSGGGCSS
jgi:small subunit ribosomal protein S17